MSVTQSTSIRRHLRRLLFALLIAPMQLHAVPDINPSLDFSDGWNAYKAGEYQEAVAIWTVLAEQGHINAQVNLGFMYDYGTGVKRNYPLAARWYRAAAHQDSAPGQYNLSLLLAEGRAEPVEGLSARYWLEKAAAQGFEDALIAVGQARIATGLRGNAQSEPPPSQAAGTPVGLEQTTAYTIEVPVSIGTAWPVAAGYAVTNHHVIDGKQHVTLINNKGDELIAEVIASDEANDIAFLRVNNPNHLPPALPLSSRGASLGASVFTIGFPRIDIMGKSPKLSQGIISSVKGLQDDPSKYQISVPIQQGNSGGPLLNMRGEVVGMITAMLGKIGVNGGPAKPISNINFALKIEVVKQFLARVPHPSVDISELRPSANDLENLAARVQDSVLIVMAE